MKAESTSAEARLEKFSETTRLLPSTRWAEDDEHDVFEHVAHELDAVTEDDK